MLFDAVTSRAFTLNQTARSVWELCDGQRNVGDIVNILTNLYEAETPILESDVLNILTYLESEQLLKLS